MTKKRNIPKAHWWGNSSVTVHACSRVLCSLFSSAWESPHCCVRAASCRRAHARDPGGRWTTVVSGTVCGASRPHSHPVCSSDDARGRGQETPEPQSSSPKQGAVTVPSWGCCKQTWEMPNDRKPMHKVR